MILLQLDLRFVCHFISGVTIWGEYADGWKNVWIYSFTYNGSYMGIEAAVTVIGAVALALLFDFNKENIIKKRS